MYAFCAYYLNNGVIHLQCLYRCCFLTEADGWTIWRKVCGSVKKFCFLSQPGDIQKWNPSTTTTNLYCCNLPTSSEIHIWVISQILGHNNALMSALDVVILRQLHLIRRRKSWRVVCLGRSGLFSLA